MNIADAIILLIILFCGTIGAKRGVFKQLVSTIGFVLVFVLAFYLKNPFAEVLSLYLPFFKFGGLFAGVTSMNIILYQVISFLVAVVILETILNVLIRVTGVIEKFLKLTIILGIPSKILGFLVGIVEGFVLVFMILFFLKQPAFHLDILKESKLTNPILNSTPVLSQISSNFLKAWNDIYDLGNEYYEQKLDTNQLDLKSIEVMLEYKIITPDYVVKLIDNGKIQIVGIDQVVNRYR